MSVTVKMISFTKRENSTKTPTTAQLNSGATFNCTMIDDTSIMNPTFKISHGGSSMIGYNYCYVSQFNRYYFITEIRTFQNFWYVTCACDVLASYKSSIGSQSHYVLRSASDYDGLLSDSIYPAKVYQHTAKYTATNPLAWSGHSYVLGIIGYAPSSGKQVGSVTYYHMDEDALNAFITYLMQDVELWSDIATAEYDPAVQEALLNPIQYIVSCMALPVAPPSTLAVNKIYFGYYEAGISTGKIDTIAVGTNITETTTFSSIPHHPEASTRGSYLNGAPFSEYILHAGPWGDIPIDPSLLINAIDNSDTLTVKIKYDMIQGVGRLVMYPTSSTGVLLCNIAAQVGVGINLTQVLRNPLDYAANANNTGLNMAAGATSMATGNVSGLVTAISALYQGMENATRLKYPTVSGKGTNGSFLSFTDSDYAFYLLHRYFDIVEENNTELGRPLCKLKQINTLSGFILCQGADCNITGTQDEAIKINEYMNTGFFYE